MKMHHTSVRTHTHTLPTHTCTETQADSLLGVQKLKDLGHMDVAVLTFLYKLPGQRMHKLPGQRLYKRPGQRVLRPRQGRKSRGGK